MKFFTCIIAPAGERVDERTRLVYESCPRSLHLAFDWHGQAGAWAMTAHDSAYRDAVATDGDWLAVGDVRIDNRAELRRALGDRMDDESDLSLVLRLVRDAGARSIASLVGDFAFVMSNTANGYTVAACDAFASRRLHHTTHHGVDVFSSRAEALSTDEQYEPHALAIFLAENPPVADLCAYRGVSRIEGGTVMTRERDRFTSRRYWSASAYEPSSAQPKSMPEAADECRQLFAEGVRLQLGGARETWAQMSGGMDSTSVVSVAQWLKAGGMARHGVAGAVTYVDRSDTSNDERQFAAAVASQWHVRHEVIVNPPIWLDGDARPPRLDMPESRLPFYPRDRQLCSIVRNAGGRVLLTGFGSDELFFGSRVYWADWMIGGRFRDAVRAMSDFATTERTSIWPLVQDYCVAAFWPRDRRRTLPRWLPRAIVRRFDLREHGMFRATAAGRPGHKYFDLNLAKLDVLTRVPCHQLLKDELDVRHPFLYRPLVEWALRLPPELCMKPHASKWVLREAMRGILPEVVRSRPTTGGPGDLIAWSFATYGELYRSLARDPILGDLGLVDAAALRTALDNTLHARDADDDDAGLLVNTLTLEGWLRIRSGRWPHGHQCTRSIDAVPGALVLH
jgi:asparagine synthase (glutamine-hydrolysing)